MRNLTRLSKPMTIKLFLLFQKSIYKSSLRLISDFFNVDKNYTVFQNTQEKILLYEYRDLFIDMDVGNYRSELAITIGIKNDEISLGEKPSFTDFDLTNDVF